MVGGAELDDLSRWVEVIGEIEDVADGCAAGRESGFGEGIRDTSSIRTGTENPVDVSGPAVRRAINKERAVNIGPEAERGAPEAGEIGR